jgi:hypothetical protein
VKIYLLRTAETGPEENLAAGGHRVARVQDEIHNDLVHLTKIGVDTA